MSEKLLLECAGLLTLVAQGILVSNLPQQARELVEKIGDNLAEPPNSNGSIDAQFLATLRELCRDYDTFGIYQEHALEGRSLYMHACEKGERRDLMDEAENDKTWPHAEDLE
jgi:hypothetical protein